MIAIDDEIATAKKNKRPAIKAGLGETIEKEDTTGRKARGNTREEKEQTHSHTLREVTQINLFTFGAVFRRPTFTGF